MTPEALSEKLAELAEAVHTDGRWQQDDLSVEVFGMLLYGFALATGRIVMILESQDIDVAVVQCLTEHVGVAAKWSQGLVAEASASAFNKAHQPAYFELIGIGHSYVGEKIQPVVVDNVFRNISSYRQAFRAAHPPPQPAVGGWFSRRLRSLFCR